jgi:glycosyltransferase involved in cell wall biosynthesis
MPNKFAEPLRNIYLVTPGGRTAKGGISRMVDYLHREWDEPACPIITIDSYGPGSKLFMPFFFGIAYLRLLFAFMAGRVGLVHVHMSERLSVFRKGAIVHLAKAFGVPVVLHLHGADFADYCMALSPSSLHRLRRMMNKASAVITLGQYWHDFVRDYLLVDEEKIAVLHNAVPEPATLHAPEKSNTCSILFLGVVCERKGVPVILRALATSPLRDLDWHIYFAGSGEVEKYQSEAREMGIFDKTTFLGWVDEAKVHEMMARSHLLVLPSRNEGLPMAILESMAFGLPIVATPVGSIEDAITSGENGILVPVGSIDGLADAMTLLVKNPHVRSTMGIAARTRYLRSFSMPEYIKRLKAIFIGATLGLPFVDKFGTVRVEVLDHTKTQAGRR